MEQAKETTFFETYRRDIESYFAYFKYKMTIRGVKVGIVLKGMKVLTELYNEKDHKVRAMKKKELEMLLWALDGMNYFHKDV